MVAIFSLEKDLDGLSKAQNLKLNEKKLQNWHSLNSSFINKHSVGKFFKIVSVHQKWDFFAYYSTTLNRNFLVIPKMLTIFFSLAGLVLEDHN